MRNPLFSSLWANRRRMCGRLLTSFALLWAILPAAAVADTLSGRVFLDANGNATYDEGERGVAGCLVSDEITIAPTNAEGTYTLETAPEAHCLFVIPPPGTWPADRWWLPIPPADPHACHFALREEPQTEPLFFVHGTDIHLGPEVVPLYQRYIQHVNALPLPVRFVVHTGDLVRDANNATLESARRLFDLYEEASRAFVRPLRNVPGNHEVAGCARQDVSPQDPGYGKALYREKFGPASYAFRYGRYHFLAVDTTRFEERKVDGGLAPEAVAWAERYLALVPNGEPILLLAHHPLGNTPNERRLLTALQGKKLLAVLCGHLHRRTRNTWGGSPQQVGGIVACGWHGRLPYPPQPHGYVLYRLEGDTVEHLFLDWAEERSIDVTEPDYHSLVRGRQRFSGVISDFAGEVKEVECAVDDVRATVKGERRGAMATAFATELDLSGLPEGVHELVVTARADGGAWVERVPMVVLSDRVLEFQPKGSATLRFNVDGAVGEGAQVLFNGELLATLEPPSTGAHTLQIPAERLKGLNRITFLAGTKEGKPARYSVRGLRMEYQGGRFRDVRFAPGDGCPVPASATEAPPETDLYVDLRYEDPAYRGGAGR